MNRSLVPVLNPAAQIIALILLFLSSLSVAAGTPETFEAARRISAESGKPLLIEFFRDG